MNRQADRDLSCSPLRKGEREQQTSPAVPDDGNSREQQEQQANLPWKSCSGAWEQLTRKTIIFPSQKKESCSRTWEQQKTGKNIALKIHLFRLPMHSIWRARAVDYVSNVRRRFLGGNCFAVGALSHICPTNQPATYGTLRHYMNSFSNLRQGDSDHAC